MPRHGNTSVVPKYATATNKQQSMTTNNTDGISGHSNTTNNSKKLRNKEKTSNNQHETTTIKRPAISPLSLSGQGLLSFPWRISSELILPPVVAR